ncbi:MAG TPA: [LysW]-aminoadipate kinase [Trueperaceae bacterium]|nr:[LysW]-aminoadipate kinase [Trueperaceae bacterium]
MIVVKVGGADGIDLAAFARDVAALTAAGQRLVVVHGGSAETNRVARALGRPPRFVTSPSGMTSRYTDRETLEVFEMVYCGKVNKGLVEHLQRLGVNAIGLSGLDGGLLRGRRKATVRSVEDGRIIVLHGDHTGTVDVVNTTLLDTLLDAGYLPVISPPALSHDGVAINVDGDRAAAAIATSMGADTLLLLSNVPGLLRDLADESSLVEGFSCDELDEYAAFASGRMKMKLLGATEAVRGGVQRVILGDARTDLSVSSALAGAGTVIRGPAA